MPIVKIPKDCLIASDSDSITVNLPEWVLQLKSRDYGKIARAKGIFKQKKSALLRHLAQVRQEWQ